MREAELDSHVVGDARGRLLCITKGMISESGPRAFYLLSLQSVAVIVVQRSSGSLA